MNQLIKKTDYVKIVKVIGDFSEDFQDAIGKIHQVKEIVNEEDVKNRQYGLSVAGHGMCYFTNSEVNLVL